MMQWIAILLLAFCLPGWMTANPTGEIVRHGDVQFDRSGGNLTITQATQHAIIDWDAFSIQNGQTTRFVQPGSSSAVLNRVHGGVISRIDGSLKANGKVFLLNPNGIVVGPSGSIDVGGFVGSTLDVSDSEFLAGGDLQFRGNSQAAVINLGSISATEGDVFLMAATVDNSGYIRAARGTVGLAAGNDVLLKEAGDERVFVRGASGEEKENGVINRGTVEANIAELKSYGGNIYGMAVQNEGRVAATGITRNGGQIFLSAGSGSKIRNTGQLRAKVVEPQAVARIKVDSGAEGKTEVGGEVNASGETGGEVVLLGGEIEIFEETLILADGDTGGGSIFVGGGHRGNDPDLANARNVYVRSGARLSARANEVGDGGEVVVFASGDLAFEGKAEAMGGTEGGDGGFVELSGKGSVRLGRLVESVDVSATVGHGGTLLIDPNDIEVVAGDPETTGDEIGGTPTSKDTLYANDVSAFLGTSNLMIQTDSGAMTGMGNITIREDVVISWTSDNDLTFMADRDFVMEKGSRITNSTTGGVSIHAGRSIQMSERSEINLGGGNVFLENYTAFDPEISDLDAIYAAGMADGILLTSAKIMTVDGNIDIKGKSGVGDGVQLQGVFQSTPPYGPAGPSIISSSGTGNITIEGEGGLAVPITSLDGDGSGVKIIEGTVSTGTGNILIKGRGSYNDDGVHLGTFDDTTKSQVLSDNGDITILGEGGDQGTADDVFAGFGIYLGEGTRIAIDNLTDTESSAEITLEGKVGNGDGPFPFAIAMDDPTESDSESGVDSTSVTDFSESTYTVEAIDVDSDTPLVSARNVTLSSLGGDVISEFVEADTLTLKDAAISDFKLNHSSVNILTGSPAGNIDFTNDKSVYLGDIGSSEEFKADVAGDIEVGGTVMAGNRIELYSEGTTTDPGLIELDGELRAPEVLLDGGIGSNVEASGDLNIEGFEFANILQVLGTSAGSGNTLSGSGQGQQARLYEFSRTSSGKGGDIVQTAFEIDMVPFIGFDNYVGGSTAETITIDLNAGENFAGTISGGDGNDRFVFLNQSTVSGIQGGNGVDTLYINDSGLGGVNTYQISENQISRNPTYNFGGIEVVQITFGPGNDTVVTGPRSFVQILDGGPGNDTLSLPGGENLGSNPIVLGGGNPIIHSNFENPAGPVNSASNSGDLLTQQVGNDEDNNPDPDSGGNVQNNFNNTQDPNDGTELFQGNLFASQGGAFSAVIVGQAAVLTVDGGDYSFSKPASLDGEFTNGTYATILRLRGNLDMNAFVELAASIGYDGSVIMIMEDGGYAIDLSGVPPAQILSLLQENLNPEAAVELLAALEMSIAIPITSEDGMVSILNVPVQPDPAMVATFAELLNPASQTELAAALDAP